MISPNLAQKLYFDTAAHRHPPPLALHPRLYQELEMSALEKSLQLHVGSRILDFGCGSGRVSLYLLRSGFNVTGLDISPSSLNELKAVYYQGRQTGWGKLKVASDLNKLSKFDAVVGADILHHVDINTELPRLFRLLKPGGRVAFSEPNPLNLTWYLHWYLAHAPWAIEKGVLHCTLSNLRYQFAIAGFTDIRISGHGLLPTRLFDMHPFLCNFNIAVLGRLTPLAFRYIISAGKPA